MEKTEKAVLRRCIQSALALEKASIHLMHPVTSLLAMQCKHNCADGIGEDIYNLITAANELQKYVNKKIILMKQCIAFDEDTMLVEISEGEEQYLIKIMEPLKKLFDGLTAREKMEAFIQLEWEVAEFLYKKRLELFKKTICVNHIHDIWGNPLMTQVYWQRPATSINCKIIGDC